MNGFRRLKLFPAVEDGNGHHIRYYQELGTSPHLYFAPQVAWLGILPDPSRLIVITEGEKKTLALAQLGLAAIGIGGLWSWMTKEGYRRLVLPELDLIVWQGRPVEICPVTMCGGGKTSCEPCLRLECSSLVEARSCKS